MSEQKRVNHTRSGRSVAAFVLAIVLILALAVGCQAENKAEDKTETAGGDTYYADITVRDYGVITVELDAAAAPETVENFVTLARQDFYDGLTFHRIMAGFMMQGGDPNGNGTGGSDKNIKGEFAANGVNNPLSHTRGAISMARQGENPFTGEKNYDSASSQFFIVHQDSPFLDGQYAVFGYVTEGMDVVDAVCADAQPVDGNGSIAKEAQPVIEDIEIYQ